MGRLGSAKLDSVVAYTIMLMSERDDGDPQGEAEEADNGKTGTGDEGLTVATAWGQKQLNSLVWALGHSNQDVLGYTAWTM